MCLVLVFEYEENAILVFIENCSCFLKLKFYVLVMFFRKKKKGNLRVCLVYIF